MKTTPLLVAMLIMLLFPTLVVSQEGTKSKASQAPSIEQQLKQMEDDWVKANKNKDVATLKHILAEDYFATGEEGKLRNKEQFISLITSNSDVIESSENFDMVPRVYGNTAVVTGGIKEKGTRNGKAYAQVERYTDVFVKRGGTWQAVVSQWIRVP